MRFWTGLLAILALAAGLQACGGRIPPPQSEPGAPAARAAVERFLQLADERDYVQMGWLFGTVEGPVMGRDPVSDVEQRMYALSSILEHDTYQVREERPVPGRTGAAVALRVALQRGGRSFQVPFTAVRGPGGRWYVEQIDIEAVTNVR